MASQKTLHLHRKSGEQQVVNRCNSLSYYYYSNVSSVHFRYCMHLNMACMCVSSPRVMCLARYLIACAISKHEDCMWYMSFLIPDLRIVLSLLLRTFPTSAGFYCNGTLSLLLAFSILLQWLQVSSLLGFSLCGLSPPLDFILPFFVLPTNTTSSLLLELSFLDFPPARCNRMCISSTNCSMVSVALLLR